MAEQIKQTLNTLINKIVSFSIKEVDKIIIGSIYFLGLLLATAMSNLFSKALLLKYLGNIISPFIMISAYIVSWLLWFCTGYNHILNSIKEIYQRGMGSTEYRIFIAFLFILILGINAIYNRLKKSNIIQDKTKPKALIAALTIDVGAILFALRFYSEPFIYVFTWGLIIYSTIVYFIKKGYKK